MFHVPSHHPATREYFTECHCITEKSKCFLTPALQACPEQARTVPYDISTEMSSACICISVPELQALTLADLAWDYKKKLPGGRHHTDFPDFPATQTS